MGLTRQEWPSKSERELARKLQDEKDEALGRLMKIIVGKDKSLIVCADILDDEKARKVLKDLNEKMFEALWLMGVKKSQNQLSAMYKKAMSE
ncbi:hypothetical protein LCGC14_1120090 [marine sediment metagenome]|uniref:Uncharacterized protein n=1 Tax=marine sediment metagenome TaxID=412755 RepID=A0A0F9M943_9ZZZZ